MIQLRLFLCIICEVLLLVACQKDNMQEEFPVPDELTIEPASVVLAVGESCQLIAKLNGIPLDGSKVRWESNSNLVNVDEDGKVTAVFQNEFISGLQVEAVVQGFHAICPITVYQEYNYKFRLILKDKGSADYSLNQPEKFLSTKAIERRRKRNIAIDDSDLPISKDYLKQIEQVGGKIVCQSKWLKTVCVQCEDEKQIDKYKELPFVEDIVKV